MPNKESFKPDINNDECRRQVLGWLVLCSKFKTIKRVKGIPDLFHIDKHMVFNFKKIYGYKLESFKENLVLVNLEPVIVPYLAVRYFRSHFDLVLRAMISPVYIKQENELSQVGVTHCIAIAENNNPNRLISRPFLIPLGRVIV